MFAYSQTNRLFSGQVNYILLIISAKLFHLNKLVSHTSLVAGHVHLLVLATIRNNRTSGLCQVILGDNLILQYIIPRGCPSGDKSKNVTSGKIVSPK